MIKNFLFYSFIFITSVLVGDSKIPQSEEVSVPGEDIIALKVKLFSIPNMNKINMVKIPPGDFIMGSPRNEVGRQPDENQHKVVISKTFYMAETEISQSQFIDFMNPEYDPVFDKGIGPWGHSLPETHQGGPWRAAGKYFKNTESAPMENVNWFEAVKFCEKLTEIEKKAGRLPKGYVYRLPTEAEWEYACRAGSQGPFNHKRIEEMANHGKSIGYDVFNDKEANSFGLYRMHMGVYEWCLDDYSGKLRDATDPLILNNGLRKVARGGDSTYWQDPLSHTTKLIDKKELLRYIRSASRTHFSPGIPLPVTGFRPVLASKINYSKPKVTSDLLIEPSLNKFR